MSKKISIIMPVYNGEKFLGEAIESLLNQTFKDFELIIVNDHSTDQSVEIVKKYQKTNSKIVLVDNNLEKGVCNTLNTGLKNATGKYIVRADADDINLPERLQIQYDFMENHKNISISAGGYIPFNESKDKKVAYHPSNSIVLAWSFVSDTYFCHPTVIFRTEIISEVGEYPKEKSEDFAFFSKILRKHRGYNIHQPLIKYREHLGSNTVIYRPEVTESAQRIYSENFKYYNNSSEGEREFFSFQSKKYLEWNNLLIVLKTNKNILRKIRADYGISVWNIGYIFTVIRITMFTILGLFRSSIGFKPS